MELIPSLYTKFQTAAHSHACSPSVMVFEHGLDHRAIYNKIMLLAALHYTSICFHASTLHAIMAQEFILTEVKSNFWELVAGT